MSEEMMDVARKAWELARDVERRVDGHEDICAIRYRQLEGSVADVRKIITWAGTAAFTLIMGALIYFIQGQFDANKEMQKTIQNLQQQQSNYERNQRP